MLLLILQLLVLEPINNQAQPRHPAIIPLAPMVVLGIRAAVPMVVGHLQPILILLPLIGLQTNQLAPAAVIIGAPVLAGVLAVVGAKPQPAELPPALVHLVNIGVPALILVFQIAVPALRFTAGAAPMPATPTLARAFPTAAGIQPGGVIANLIMKDAVIIIIPVI